MKRNKLSLPIRIIFPSVSKLEKHIDYCRYMLEICNRKSNNLKPYYFQKQIEESQRRLKPLLKI